MIKLKNLLIENHKKQFVGDCVGIIDCGTLFNDATEMAQAIENSSKVDYQHFIENVNPDSFPDDLITNINNRKNDFEFGMFEELLWAYDSDTDVHYFFI